MTSRHRKSKEKKHKRSHYEDKFHIKMQKKARKQRLLKQYPLNMEKALHKKRLPKHDNRPPDHRFV